jgi:hypothetical protein
MSRKVHKTGKGRVEKYLGFGAVDMIPVPLCVGAKGLYKGNSYLVSHKWDKVTCSHCLRKKPLTKKYY